jgi:hypothetical protein
MPTVRLAFTPAPQYVRTARLVGVAVGQRAGVADELLDGVRQAVGEACARAVARHQRYGVTDLVQVVMSDDGPYTVRVLDACGGVVRGRSGQPGGAAGSGGDWVSGFPGSGPSDDEVAEADRMADTLLAALVNDLEVRAGEDGTEVRMVWPVRRRLIGAE